jgi:hypothetical protein
MSQGKRVWYVAGLALALSIYAVARGPRDGTGSHPEACVDPQARDQLAELRRELAARDALIGRMARAASPPAAPTSAAEAGANVAGAPALSDAASPEAPPEIARRRYARFETANPAVSVTQNADGGYEIRNTDPALAGSVMQVTAVSPSGEQTKVLIRIPQ